MKMRVLLSLAAMFGAAFTGFAADGWQTVDLRAFTNYSAFDSAKAPWLLPTGAQVFDGAPFQVEGIIQLRGAGRKAGSGVRAAPQKVEDIPVGTAFERLHLLTAIDGSAAESNVVARIRLDYEDGSQAVLELTYGDQVRNWTSPWHRTERALRDPDSAAVAWVGLPATVVESDRFARLYHVWLTNPHPGFTVKSLALEAGEDNCGPFFAGITVAAADARRMTNTVKLPTIPFPDLRRRGGEPAVLKGVVRTWTGQPVSNALVRVVAQRDLRTRVWETDITAFATGAMATTDAKGHFALPPLPDDKLYHLVVWAMDRETTFFSGADALSLPVEIRMRKSQPDTNKFRLRLKVVDGDGNPVAAALAEVGGVRYNGGTRYGGREGFPDQVATDSNGELELSRTDPFTAVQLEFTSPGLAPHKCWVDVTDVVQTVTMDVGATLRGRVKLDGRPLANVKMGVTGVERNSEVFAGHFEATTDADGVFVFEHLPARISWWLHGVMSSLKEYGAVRPRQLISPHAGETNDVGDVEVGTGYRLAGRVQSRDGKPWPDGLRVTVSAENLWDSQSSQPDDEGRFEFTGIAPGLISVSINQNKWRLTGANRSLDDWNPWELIGLLTEDKDDLLLEIEPGNRIYSSMNTGGQLPPADQARARPLFGAEPSGPAPIALAGQVLDDSTGKPVQEFKIVPGRKPPVAVRLAPRPMLQRLAQAFHKPPTPWNEMPWWNLGRAETCSNGQFSLNFQPLTSTPVFRVEAHGYEPFISEPYAFSTNGLVVRLTSGTGPNGVVLQPDGRPAEGATVWYAISREQGGLAGRSLSTYGNKEACKTTGADGHFAFPARPEGRKLFIAHTSGWAEMEVKPDAAKLKIELKPWAVVTGTLVDTNGVAMPRVTLHLSHTYDWNAGDPIINMQGNVVTDAQGGFTFDDATPGRLDLNRVIPVSGNGWTYQLQTWFFCEPGVTNDLGKVEYDLPPPPPLSEKIKKVLGY